ncbi:MAG: SDR family oxidoreductase [Gemmatimonadota bacterium]|nr:SDR family oxidoreductase [Gemmatimonadota bacterium]
MADLHGELPPLRELAGAHAVVTGGGSGIGAAIAAELARRGAALTLMGRRHRPLEEHSATLGDRFGVAVAAIPCDVAEEGSVRRAFAAARERSGDPTILVNNAGQAAGSSFAETSLELWQQMLAVNLTGSFLCARAVLPAMLAASSGRIVNIASTAGLRGYPHIAAYSAAKHGVIGLTRSLALETVKKGVTVNAVCPGYTDTGMTDGAADGLSRARGISAEEARALISRSNPRGTLIRPEEVADAVAWLCSPAASAITGQALVVAAGEVMAG